MSMAQLMPQLATLRDDRAGSDEMAWKVLYARRRQPLLVPLDTSQARSAIAFFIRNPWLRLWGNLLLTLDRWVPRTMLLSTVKLEQFPTHILFDASDLTETALYCGFPGPLQKLTMYCPGRDGAAGRVAKIAMHASADDAIAREAHWLDTLGNSEQTAAFLPRLLQQGTLPCGRRFLAMQALPQGFPAPQFGELHRNFLKVLAQHTVPMTAWRESAAYARLAQRLSSVLPLVSPQHRQLLQGVFDEIGVAIGTRQLPSCLVHADFVPWNLRLTQNQLFVFDWEYAEASGNPLQDYLHFHLLPRALQFRPLRAAHMPRLLAQTRKHANDVFGSDSGVAEACGALTLHYLLDTVTFYTAASGYLAQNHPVQRTYMRLLAARAAWLPPTAREYSENDPGR